MKKRSSNSVLTRLPQVVQQAERLGPLGAAVMLATPVVAAALFHVWTHVTTVHLGYQLSRADAAHAKLVESNLVLSTEVSALLAPQRLKALAKEFQLSPPKAEQVVPLKDRPLPQEVKNAPAQ